MSLIYGDDFKDKRSLEGKKYCFKNLFYSNASVAKADKMILPATKLSEACYIEMFAQALNLQPPPKPKCKDT